MARRAKGRPVNGIFLLDKPGGISSNRALQIVKRLYGAAKAGHTGALDPLATGMLPLCFGEATKFSQFLLNADKRYITTAKLGQRTDTSDADGQVVEERPLPENLTLEQIDDLLQSQFTGLITQVPSMFSALKHNGQPLYKLARQGIEVEVKSRQITVYSIDVLDFRGDEVDLDIRCSKGTYIRSIVQDMGEMLGCGAHVQMLRRLDSGPYKADKMMPLADLEQLVADMGSDAEPESIQKRLDELLLPSWSPVADTPEVQLTESQTRTLCFGQTVVLDFPSGENPAEPLIRIIDADSGRFLGIGEIDEKGHILPRRLMSTQ
ncbi:tRNA pseudouridine(55) synthase TruB [Amphritea balenae]|uniref:tRNA pseudouridine synthase B n=1 Tax=Amphritea balenae TaxID=452629 RepID=A0A3P1SIE8_9GAMM|nr:tRNA pseudouridine(55) synthase TruB [Amphritea balenae]RRC96928.1 tRNA pseudouridine(55) synthase TruB [Amphritea balenae]GGK85601.1 tRNA pseudouridine synthase B [Amphritea balenae]